jgi:hypothetical protein
MADFIAVIRRAVDGLTDNTPEMRVKVYERARGAVQRQLENMKPRPPEAMLQRQLEKLEAAIREVEAEHAVALPSEDGAPIAGVAAAIAPEPAIDTEQQYTAAAEPVAGVPEAEEQRVHDEPPHHEQPVAAEAAAVEATDEDEPAFRSEKDQYQQHAPYGDPAPYQEPAGYDEPVSAHDLHGETTGEDQSDETQAWTAQEDVPVVPEPVAPWQAPHGDDGARADEAAREERLHDLSPDPVDEPYLEPEAAVEEPVEEAVPVARPVAREFDLGNRLVEPVHALERAPKDFVEHSLEEPLRADAAAHFDPVWSEPAEKVPEPDSQAAATDWALEELRQFSEAPQAAPANDAARAFEDVASGIQNPPEPAKMPAANEGFSWEAAAFDDLPPIDNERKVSVNARFDDSDLFSEIHGMSSPKSESPGSDAWQEATQLRGYDNRGVVAEDEDGLSPADVDSAIAAKFQGKNFRMEPKRRRFGLGSIFAVLLALGVVGGGGYAAWTNQGALVDMVKGLVSAAPSQTAKTAPQVPAKPVTTPPVSQAGDPASATKPVDAQKDVASLNDGSAANNKFTQRLLADGTEVDSGPAVVASAQTAEGKSVAEQNVASADATPPGTAAPAEAPVAPATAAPATATPAAATAPAATQTAAPVDSSEKLFLYEERIGQSSPTAIQGSVVWSLQHEAGPDGKQQAVVRGAVTVPERNLTAQLNFKRNSDPSLPASHIVEVVFSLPPNFEGGAIDSVQRISMKRTEQDRGDALIAVPAKITDDFHMIALNDYPDARKANLDLLANRDWIDVPITYRNGRRALLTMQKGTTGGQAFAAAIKEWAAAGDVSTSQ